MTIRTRSINRRYRIERRLTLADRTETWLGFDNVLHRAVSVTLPRQEWLRDAGFQLEFLQRSQIATALHHRGIVAAFDSGEDGGLPYLVTEHVGGDSLTEIIRAEAPFDVDDVAILVGQVASSLDYAHQRGFVHGSLTASDVIVDGQGATKLLGLGLPTGAVAARNKGGHRILRTFDDDVQALASIAFEMLTGEAPTGLEAESLGEAYLIDPDVPRNASDIVAIGLGAGPARFSSAGSFARSLRDWRNFDPGEHFIAPDPLPEPMVPAASFQHSAVLPLPETEDEGWLDADELSEVGTETGASASNRRLRMALVAALLLALLAGIIVWRASDATAGPSVTLPPEVQTLAELSGF